ncbi:MAG: hypothetical protein ACRCWJ_20310, partial [Casimicrobium sp.]
GTYSFRLVVRDTNRSGHIVTKSEIKSVNLTAGTALDVTSYFANSYLGSAYNLAISHEDVTGPSQLSFLEAAAPCSDTSTTDHDGGAPASAIPDIGFVLRGDTDHYLTQVVEYNVPSINKYFITGNDEEKALLDSHPTVYTRTGKRFYLPSKQRYGNVSDVYRFYAPAPGPNSHVMVEKNERDWIVSLPNTGLIDEGIALGTVKPDASGTCPTWSPVKIYRSFHNTADVSQRNHRYTNNLTDYNAMTAQGWSPEGVVFCAYTTMLF